MIMADPGQSGVSKAGKGEAAGLEVNQAVLPTHAGSPGRTHGIKRRFGNFLGQISEEWVAALSTLCTRDYADVTGKNPPRGRWACLSGHLGHCRPEKGTSDLPRAAWRPLPPLHRSLPGPRGMGDRPVFLAVYPLVLSVSVDLLVLQ